MPVPAFEVVLLPYPPTPALAAGAGPAAFPLSPGRAELDSLGRINRAIERDLLSFRTGDLTIQLADGDGAVEDQLSALGPTDRWQILITDGDSIVFRGVVLGKGSISYDRRDKRVEITAYGPTKILQDTSAETVKRSFGVITLLSNVAVGATTLSLSSTAGLATNDVLHLSDEVNREDVTILQVTSATAVSLVSATTNAYVTTVTRVDVVSPYHRYRTADFLVRELFAAAGLPILPPVLDKSQFAGIAPSLINVTGLDLGNFPWGGPAERNALAYVTISVSGTYKQDSPENAWVNEDADLRPWIDWSPYYSQAEAAPAVALRCPITNANADGDDRTNHPWCSGWDFRSATRATYWLGHYSPQIGGPRPLYKKTTTDGVTWSARSKLGDQPGTGTTAGVNIVSAEFDPVRNGVYSEHTNGNGDHFSHFYDIGLNTFTSLIQADDTTHGYFGFRYVNEKDYTLCLRSTDARGAAWEICAFRRATRLWKRAFPNAALRAIDGLTPYVYPTQTIRMVNGVLYGLVINDGAVQLVRSEDEFLTYTIGKLADLTTDGRYWGGRVNGAYFVQSYKGTVPKNYQMLRPFFNALVEYADFTGKSVSDALKQLAVLTNSIYWVDDDLVGHMVARDLLPVVADPVSLDGQLLEDAEVHQWDEARQYAVVSGAGVSGKAGNKAYVNDSVQISSDFLPNQIFADLLAQQYVSFFSKRRRMIRASAPRELAPKMPLDRVLIDGRRYLVYESSDDLSELTTELSLLEDS